MSMNSNNRLQKYPHIGISYYYHISYRNLNSLTKFYNLTSRKNTEYCIKSLILRVYLWKFDKCEMSVNYTYVLMKKAPTFR